MSKRDDANLPVDYNEELQKRAEELSNRVQAAVADQIKIVNNREFETPDGQKGKELAVVIVDFIAGNYFYDRPYDKDAISPPACFAIGLNSKLLVPSKNSPDIQVADGSSCADCPHNVFGSADNNKGKACSNRRVLAVLPMEQFDKDIWTLSVPPTSLKYFDRYANELSTRYKKDLAMVATRVFLDEAQAWASPRFELTRPLTPEQINQVGPRLEQARIRLMTEPDVSGYEAPKKVKRG